MDAWLNETNVAATMTGRGGSSDVGGFGEIGITNGTLYAIDLGGGSSDAWLDSTTVTAMMEGSGGNGGVTSDADNGVGGDATAIVTEL